jgi:quinol-cytochrome oxidoreductase complex cytochrome b subunit
LQSRFRYTLGAGGLAVFLSLVLLVTGILEMYFYVPSPEQAAVSVETITTLVPFGNLIRNLHFWSAQLLVVVMTVHLLRVVLTGAYALPRRFNFLLGLGLLVFILLLDFTGYVLRWDEGIRWALVVGANLLKTIPWIGEGLYLFAIGGNEPGTATLTRFYAWHIFGLTLGATILVVWHIFRVRRDGGIAVPPPTQREDNTRINRFVLLKREVLAMTIASAILLLLAMLVPAPIDQPISNTSLAAGDSRAPWFFLWVQQMLKWGDPFLLGVLAPVLVVVALGLLPYVLPNVKDESLGHWFPRGNRIAQALAALIIFSIFILTVLGAISR